MNITHLPIAHHVLLAEFDIDTGSCLRAIYPPPPPLVTDPATPEGGNIVDGTIVVGGRGYALPGWDRPILYMDNNYCASHMLPDGAEKQVVSRTVFITNRPRPAITKRFPVYYFTLETALPGGSTANIVDLSSGGSLNWVRSAAADDPFVSEVLHQNGATDMVWICYEGNVVFGPVSIATLEVYPSLPPGVSAFAHELCLWFLHHGLCESTKNDTASAWRNEPLLLGEASSLPFASRLSQSSVVASEYSFVVLRDASMCHGFLLRSVQAEELARPRSGQHLAVPSGGKRSQAQGESNLMLNGMEAPVTPPLFALCAVVTRKDASVRRGGISKSVALLGPTLVWLEPFFPLLVETALQCCDVKGKTDEALEVQKLLLKRCFDAVESATRPLQQHLQDVNCLLEMEIMRICTISSKLTHMSYSTSPFGTLHQLRIPLSPKLTHFTFSRYGLEQLVEVCGTYFWSVIVAVLLQKRVVILSRQGLPNDVCEAALSLGLIGNLLDPNFTATRVFPCTSVNGFSHFSHVPGYIVGTLNPIFETQQAWWDVLCDLDNRCVLLSSEGGGSNNISSNTNNNNNNNTTTTTANDNKNNSSDNVSTSTKRGGGGGVGWAWEGAENAADPSAVHDVQFSKYILERICRMRAMREPLCELNRAVLLMVEEYLGLMVVVDREREVFGHANVARCIRESFLSPSATRLCACVRRGVVLDDTLESDPPLIRRLLLLPPGSEESSLLLSTATLRRANSCNDSELLQALKSLLSCVKSRKGVLLLLRCMPLALDGLNPLAAQLLHPSLAVRQAALELMQRVEVFPPGKAASVAMNNFFFMVYEEACKDAV